MNVLVADKFSMDGMEEMKAQGLNVVYDASLKEDSLVKAMQEHKPNVLIVRSTKVTSTHIDCCDELKMIIRAGAGTDTIDGAHAKSKQIILANCPGKNAHAVAELAFGLMLSIDRRISEGHMLLKNGKWEKGMFASCKGIYGRTLGIIGFGAIGKLVCERAKAFGMNVLVHTRTPQPGLDKEMGFTYAEHDELLKQSDIISLHTPATPETKGSVNEKFLALLKPDAVLLNTSRGNLVNDECLLAHLIEHPNFWYGTDVFNGEPSVASGEFSNDLTQHSRVYGTHHCGASTLQAEEAIGIEAVRICMKYKEN